jgi:hypothetical protein
MKQKKNVTRKKSDRPTTLTKLAQEKVLLKAKIRKSKKRMKETSDLLFYPTPSKTKGEMFFQAAQKGFALYDGLMMGYKVTKLIQSILKVRKK